MKKPIRLGLTVCTQNGDISPFTTKLEQVLIGWFASFRDVIVLPIGGYSASFIALIEKREVNFTWRTQAQTVSADALAVFQVEEKRGQVWLTLTSYRHLSVVSRRAGRLPATTHWDYSTDAFFHPKGRETSAIENITRFLGETIDMF